LEESGITSWSADTVRDWVSADDQMRLLFEGAKATKANYMEASTKGP
jgi:hypothetical protein